MRQRDVAVAENSFRRVPEVEVQLIDRRNAVGLEVQPVVGVGRQSREVQPAIAIGVRSRDFVLQTTEPIEHRALRVDDHSLHFEREAVVRRQTGELHVVTHSRDLPELELVPVVVGHTVDRQALDELIGRQPSQIKRRQ